MEFKDENKSGALLGNKILPFVFRSPFLAFVTQTNS